MRAINAGVSCGQFREGRSGKKSGRIFEGVGIRYDLRRVKEEGIAGD
jgi:hypothetical protein